MEYGREMWEKQNQAENDRMALQNQWNKEAAAQSQQYAKEMFDYTGYENQVKQMKAAGLNPALMNGGGGTAGKQVRELKYSLLRRSSRWDFKCHCRHNK